MVKLEGRDVLLAINIANTMRAIGGFDPVDDLVPGVISDSQNCVLAATFNCSCKVDGVDGDWHVYFKKSDYKYAQALAAELGVSVKTLNDFTSSFKRDWIYKIPLPESVGKIADDFDSEYLPAKYYLRGTYSE